MKLQHVTSIWNESLPKQLLLPEKVTNGEQVTSYKEPVSQQKSKLQQLEDFICTLKKHRSSQTTI